MEYQIVTHHNSSTGFLERLLIQETTQRGMLITTNIGSSSVVQPERLQVTKPMQMGLLVILKKDDSAQLTWGRGGFFFFGALWQLASKIVPYRLL